jgi:hypothetical protein
MGQFVFEADRTFVKGAPVGVDVGFPEGPCDWLCCALVKAKRDCCDGPGTGLLQWSWGRELIDGAPKICVDWATGCGVRLGAVAPQLVGPEKILIELEGLLYPGKLGGPEFIG